MTTLKADLDRADVAKIFAVTDGLHVGVGVFGKVRFTDTWPVGKLQAVRRGKRITAATKILVCMMISFLLL
jgi:hypothetical protein